MVLVADPGCRLYWCRRELQWTAPWAGGPRRSSGATTRPLTAYSPKSRRPIADSFRRTAPAVVRLCLASIPGSSSSRRDSATFGSDSTCSTAW